MPTPTGLPKVGEVWKLTIPLPDATTISFVVLERSRGEYWSIRGYLPARDGRRARREYMKDPAYWLRQGWLTYVGVAGPKTRKLAGLP